MRNSTSTIIGRLLLVLIALVGVHAGARVIWYWDVTHMNPSYRWPTIERTLFIDYTPSLLGWVASHLCVIFLVGLVVVTAVGLFLGAKALATWIFMETSEDEEGELEESELLKCTIPWCRCGYHKADIFKDGKWVVPDCTQASCRCGYHEVDEFVDGVWVELQA